MKSFPSAGAAGFQGGVGAAFPTTTPAVAAGAATGLPHYAIHQGIPYNVYG